MTLIKKMQGTALCAIERDGKPKFWETHDVAGGDWDYGSHDSPYYMNRTHLNRVVSDIAGAALHKGWKKIILLDAIPKGSWFRNLEHEVSRLNDWGFYRQPREPRPSDYDRDDGGVALLSLSHKGYESYLYYKRHAEGSQGVYKSQNIVFMNRRALYKCIAWLAREAGRTGAESAVLIPENPYGHVSFNWPTFRHCNAHAT